MRKTQDSLNQQRTTGTDARPAVALRAGIIIGRSVSRLP